MENLQFYFTESHQHIFLVKTKEENYGAVSCPQEGQKFFPYEDPAFLEVWFKKKRISPLKEIPEELKPLLEKFIEAHESENVGNLDKCAQNVLKYLEKNSLVKN